MDLSDRDCVELEDGKVNQTFVEFLQDIIQKQQIEHEAIERMRIRAHIRIHA